MKIRTSFVLFLLACSAGLILSCGDDGGDGGVDASSFDAASFDAAPSPSCLEAESHSDLAWIQDNVLTPSCANFSACHQGLANNARGLNLESGNSEVNMVGVASDAFPNEILVVPGDPASSYLMVVLGSYDGPQLQSGTMPPNNPLLCVQKREAVERWIQGLPLP